MYDELLVTIIPAVAIAVVYLIINLFTISVIHTKIKINKQTNKINKYL